MTRSTIHLSDVLTGVFAALVEQGVTKLSVRGNLLDAAFVALSAEVEREAEAAGLEVRYLLDAHPMHGDSLQLQDELHEAAKRDLISLDNPEFQDIRIKLSTGDSPFFLRRLPGSPDMYRRLAGSLLSHYRNAVRA